MQTIDRLPDVGRKFHICETGESQLWNAFPTYVRRSVIPIKSISYSCIDCQDTLKITKGTIE